MEEEGRQRAQDALELARRQEEDDSNRRSQSGRRQRPSFVLYFAFMGFIFRSLKPANYALDLT